MDKVSRDKAEQEISKWLDFRNVKAKKREKYQDSIESLTDAVCDGTITISDKGVLTLNLNYPIGDDGASAVTKLEFKPRVKQQAIQLQLQGAKANDAMGMIMGYMSAITGQSKALIQSMDNEDYNLAAEVVIFFL